MSRRWRTTSESLATVHADEKPLYIYIGPARQRKQALRLIPDDAALQCAAEPHVVRRFLESKPESLPAYILIGGTSKDLDGLAPDNLVGAFSSYSQTYIQLLKPEEIKKNKSVAFFATDGGAGTSTIAAYYAWQLSQHGNETCLVDFDLQFGRLASLLDVSPARDGVNLIAGVPESYERLHGFTIQAAPQLRFFQGCLEPETSEVLSSHSDNLVQAILRTYSSCVFDLGSVWNDVLCSTLLAVDTAYLVTDFRGGALSRIERALELCTRLGIPRTKITLVVNRMDEERLERLYGERLNNIVGAQFPVAVPEVSSEINQLESLDDMERLAKSSPEFIAAIEEDLLQVGDPLTSRQKTRGEGEVKKNFLQKLSSRLTVGRG